MEEFLKKIGMEIEIEGNETSIKLYSINNPDGTTRWIWNSKNPSPDFLKFYAASTFKAKIFVLVFRLMFLFRLQHLFFMKKKISVSLDGEHVLFNYLNNNFALFTGTKGPNRKLVLYVNSLEGSKFIKIALSPVSRRLIETEHSNIQIINQFESNSFILPQSFMLKEDIVVMEDISRKGKSTNQMSDIQVNALVDIFKSTSNKENLQTLTCFKNAQLQLDEVITINNSKIPTGLIEKLEFLQGKLSNQEILTAYAHKDFTPWNTISHGDKISIFDWELASPKMPMAFDLFHYVIQKGILIERKNWLTIKSELIDAFSLFSTKIDGVNEDDFELYLKIYLILNTAYYLRIYALQEDWHVQISWLLNTWNDACSDFIKNEQINRELLISDVFDYLKNRSYATIKLEDIEPKKISQYSDIDICMSKEDALGLIQFLQKSSLVKSVEIKKYSFMIASFFALKDGSSLALDFIWKFKRKNLQFLDVKKVLENSFVNTHGIQSMSIEDTRFYINCFYALNYSKIPQKYMAYFDEKHVELDRNGLCKQLNKAKFNKGISAVINYFSYINDSIKGIFMGKGLIVTFSGVDGAGKSTIIEHTKLELEKRFRKKVVVIRHRPSILPIISAITHGKAAAEQRSMQSLPRQGNNKSFISSFARFMYYYTDYFFGQFIIYFKYVFRGHVVLYDRYYFDFINDSVRSNIRLPKWFLNLGYRFLISPNINIFLYADAATILKRKQELEEATIKSLTKSYLELFAELSAREKRATYMPIENIDLDQTMGLITDKIAQKLF